LGYEDQNFSYKPASRGHLIPDVRKSPFTPDNCVYVRILLILLHYCNARYVAELSSR